MGWKDWPYWKKGVILSSSFFIILYILLSIVSYFQSCSFICIPATVILIIPYYYIGGLISNFTYNLPILDSFGRFFTSKLDSFGRYETITPLIISGLIFIFVVTLVFWIFGEIKQKKITKTKIVIGVIIIIFIIFIHIVALNVSKNPYVGKNVTLEYCNDYPRNIFTSKEFSESWCFYLAAMNEKNLTLCYSIEEEVYHNACFSRMAKILNDSSICDEIPADRVPKYNSYLEESATREFCYGNFNN